MKLERFLNKKTPKEEKLKVLEKMLQRAKDNGGTVSVAGAREIIKTHVEKRSN
jgi:hypothetical protein|tara:strand:- start:240 stop:398 length:159 start_codon:yes stop_codon:yes gene_type:complete